MIAPRTSRIDGGSQQLLQVGECLLPADETGQLEREIVTARGTVAFLGEAQRGNLTDGSCTVNVEPWP